MTTAATESRTESDATGADTELAAAEAAVNDASSFADITHASGDAGTDAKGVERTVLNGDQRAALSRDIARRQRKLGTAELEKEYPSAIVVAVDIKLNDPNIASSASRFLGLADRTIYLVNRFGSRFMSDSEMTATRESISSRISTYAQEAAQALEQGKQLTGEAKTKNVDWLSPSYTSSALEMPFSVKARETMELVRALRSWDEAILEFASLEFNDGATIGQINTLRIRERKLVQEINRQCIRVISAFYKRQKDNGSKRNKKEEESSQVEPA